MTRNLIDVCDKEDFHLDILRNNYCSLSMNRKIDCPYMSDKKDQNGLHPCNNPNYTYYPGENHD